MNTQACIYSGKTFKSTSRRKTKPKGDDYSASKTCSKKWLRELEKDYMKHNAVVMQCGWEDARTLHSKLYCAVCQKYENRVSGMKHFDVFGLLGRPIKKLQCHGSCQP